MDTNWAAAIMGVVEGLTEFVPVSSTGHLILAGHLLHFDERLKDTFEIFIQLGAILAVVAAYPGRFAGLLNFRRRDGFHGARGLLLLACTTAPAAAVGLAVHGYITRHLFSPLMVAAGLVAGGLWILIAERFPRAPKLEGVDALTWRDALAIGCFQCLSLWPGFSRSVSTILGGMALGVDRKTSTEYSFFAAVPVLGLASLYSLAKGFSVLRASDLPAFAIGTAVSFLFGWLAVRFLIRFLSRHTLTVFGWYRLALAAGIGLLMLRA